MVILRVRRRYHLEFIGMMMLSAIWMYIFESFPEMTQIAMT
jgi:hypothetical protein